MAGPRNDSWFERHSLISLAGVLLFILISGLAVVEKVLERQYTARGTNFAESYDRLIRMRETRPNSTTIFDRVHNGKTETVLMRGDSNGFIEPTTVHESPDAKVVFLGGSTTEAYQVTETLRFPYLAGRLIEEKTGIRINAFNGGKGANHSLHSLFVLLGKVIPMKPDVVVIMHAINDMGWHVKTRGDYWTTNPDPKSALGDLWDQYLVVIARPLDSDYRGATDLLRNIKNATIPFTWLTIRTAMIQAKQDPTLLLAMSERDTTAVDVRNGPETPFGELEHTALANFRHSLETLVATARIWGIQPVLMTQPRLDLLKPRANRDDQHVLRIARLHDAANQIVRDVARDKSVVMVDLYAMVDAQLDKASFFIDTIHYSDAGSEFIGHRVADALASELCRLKPVPGAKC